MLKILDINYNHFYNTGKFQVLAGVCYYFRPSKRTQGRCELYSVLTSRVARPRVLQHCGGHRRGEQALPHRGGHLQRQGLSQHRPRGQVSILLPDCGLQQTQQVRIEFLNFNVDTNLFEQL